MKTTIPLRCRCGDVRGAALEISPATGNRVVCMCDDCQASAHFLECPDEVLDANGGTDIFQLTPSQLRISQGHDRLACMRLTPKGLVRWYTACCKTPVANTIAMYRFPFAGIPHSFMEHQGGPEARDASLGPIRARIWGRFGKGELPPGTHKKAPVGMLPRLAGLLFLAWIRGKYQPSPFFHPPTGQLLVQPTILSRQEREGLRQIVDG